MRISLDLTRLAKISRDLTRSGEVSPDLEPLRDGELFPKKNVERKAAPLQLHDDEREGES